MIEDLKDWDGLIGIIGGAVAGAVAMLYQKSKTDKQIEENEMRIRQVELNMMPRSEIVDLHKEIRDDTKAQHKETNDKLETVIEKLSDLSVALAGKADK